MSLQIIDGPTIPAGESLSEGVDCSAGQIVRITVPQEFTQANMTFEVSSDGALYNAMFDPRGNEITITAKPNSGIVVVGEPWVRTIGWIKLRSGSRDHPVSQREACKFAIALEIPELG
ncbi:hypothetical protein [Bradyrhizobium zhanjiangense]|uniref:Uncharacterized protein n=1 Tax=Bradyrhizobium zhanjiangense TaxID=1325107 RepID=A0ABY0DI30_9BRAD|nr:hypothetical protein [Bradyrhizobium zhanjiangense]RXG91571.1 hypothetical protein EAS62_24130 [Bradyrhizobium zhanjiangense]